MKEIMIISLLLIIGCSADWYEDEHNTIKYSATSEPPDYANGDWERKQWASGDWFYEEYHFKEACCKTNIKYLDIVTDMIDNYYCDVGCHQKYNQKTFYFPTTFQKTQLVYLYIKALEPRTKFLFDASSLPDEFFIHFYCDETNRTRCRRTSHENTRVHVKTSGPFRFYSYIDEHVNFVNPRTDTAIVNPSYVYIDGDVKQTLTFTISADYYAGSQHYSRSRYVLTGWIEKLTFNQATTNYKLLSVCDRTLNDKPLSRWMAFNSDFNENQLEPQCHCNAWSGTLDKYATNYEYPDCPYNSTYYDLELPTSTATDYTISIYEWYTINFQESVAYTLRMVDGKTLSTANDCYLRKSTLTISEGHLDCGIAQIYSPLTLHLSTGTSASGTNCDVYNGDTLQLNGGTFSCTNFPSSQKCTNVQTSSNGLLVVENCHYETKSLTLTGDMEAENMIVGTNTITLTDTSSSLNGGILRFTQTTSTIVNNGEMNFQSLGIDQSSLELTLTGTLHAVTCDFSGKQVTLTSGKLLCDNMILDSDSRVVVSDGASLEASTCTFDDNQITFGSGHVSCGTIDTKQTTTAIAIPQGVSIPVTEWTITDETITVTGGSFTCTTLNMGRSIQIDTTAGSITSTSCSFISQSITMSTDTNLVCDEIVPMTTQIIQLTGTFIPSLCKYKSKTITLQSGTMKCTTMEIDSSTSVTIQESSTMEVTTITVSGTGIDNLNKNGIVKAYGTLSFGTGYSITLQETPSTCYELVSSVKPITASFTNDNIVFIENRLIRVCPSATTRDLVMKCTLTQNEISDSMTYKQTVGEIIQCPCSTSNCYLTMTVVNSDITITKTFEGTLELPANSNHLIHYQITTPTLSLVTNGNVIHFDDPFTIFEGFQLRIQSSGSVVVVSDKKTYGLKSIGTDSIVMELKSQYHCTALHYDGTDIKCLTCLSRFEQNICLDELVIDKCTSMNTNDFTCQQCEEGYGVSYDECIKCSSNCLDCFDSTACKKCANGYYLNDGSCHLLDTVGCIEYQGNRCLKCRRGYSLANGKCIQLTDERCHYENGQCVSCPVGYYVSQNKCVEKSGTNMNSQNKPIHCENKKYNDDSTCVDCTLKFAGYCDSGRVYTCLDNYRFTGSECESETCNQNEVEDENGQCVNYIDNCANVVNEECVECVNPYYFDKIETTLCVKDAIDACVQYSTLGCQRCNDTFYVNLQQHTCIECKTTIPNCYSCNEFTGKELQCDECYLDYYLEKNSCQQCHEQCVSGKCDKTSGVCSLCQVDYYPNPENTKECIGCNSIQHCIACDQHRQWCTKCGTGFYAKEGTCHPCSDISNCDECKGDEEYCTKCNSEWFADGGVCLNCVEETTVCKTCSARNDCQTCVVDNYFLNQMCYPCHENCTTTYCVESTGVCTQCDEGYYPHKDNPKTCVPCSQITNCVECHRNEMFCTKCISGWYASTDGNCYNCLESTNKQCLTCTSQNECTSCNTDYYLNEHTCLPCHKDCVSGKCDPLSGKCSQCSPGSYINTLDPKECLPCHQQCRDNLCSIETGECPRCKQDYYPNPLNKIKCIPCDSKCVSGECDGTNGVCSTCTNGMYPNPQKPEVCIKCHENCTESACNPSSGVCSMCLEGSYPNPVDPTECLLCSTIDKCVECSGSTKHCTKCEDGFYSDNGVCKECSSISNCDKCRPTEGAFCTVCLENHFANDVGVCQLCTDIPECETCSRDKEYCLKCEEGFTPMHGVCSNCKIDYCVKCDSESNKCNECMKGFYINGTGCANCTDEIVGCEECSDEETCTLCFDNYYLNKDNTCTECHELCADEKCDVTNGTCYECQPNHYPNPKNTLECIKCHTECSDGKCITTDGTCTQCNPGYYPNPSNPVECIPCDEHCQSGKCDQITGVCSLCSDTWHPNPEDTRICVECTSIDHCLQCDPSKKEFCTLCEDEWFADEDGVCQNCTEATDICVTCSSTRNCFTCITDYYAEDGKCLPCDENCVSGKCNGENGFCEECKPNHYLDGEIQVECRSCDVNCVENTCWTTNGVCPECKTGYYPTPGLEYICRECDYDCVPGKCSPTDGTCFECKNMYYPNPENPSECVECSTIKDCYECMPDREYCTKCNTGWYADEGECWLCANITGCSKCSSDTKYCTECVSGKVWNDGECFDCDSITNCISCSQTEHICLDCSDGFFANGSSCVKCSFTMEGCVDCETEDVCEECTTDYFLNTTTLQCDHCHEQCVSGQCNSVSGECSTCKKGYYPNPKNRLECMPCDENCQEGQCNTQTGECLVCKSGWYVNEDEPSTCIPCDKHCPNENCDSTSGTCSECDKGWYPNPRNPEECIACHMNCTSGNCNPRNGTCSECDLGLYPNPEYDRECIRCETIPLCNMCDQRIEKCVECYPPYIANEDGVCIACGSGHYHSNGVCKVNDLVGCEIQIHETMCVKCFDGYYIHNHECHTIHENENDICSDISSVGCDTCEKGINIAGNCIESNGIEHCKYYYQTWKSDETECLSCEDNYIYNNETKQCEEIQIDEPNVIEGYIRNNVIYHCDDGYYLTYNNTCEECLENMIICQNYQYDVGAYSCSRGFYFDDTINKCLPNPQCIEGRDCVCSECMNKGNYSVVNGTCRECNIDHCAHCQYGKCMICEEGYLLLNDTECVIKEDHHCSKANQHQCVECQLGFTLTEIIREDMEAYSHCGDIEMIGCDYLSLNTKTNSIECKACEEGYDLKNGTCEKRESEQENVEESDTSSDSIEQVEGEETPINMKREEKDNCHTHSEKGCVRCVDGFFIDNYECKPCENGCATCYNETYCLSCPETHFLYVVDNTCQLNSNETKELCEFEFPDNTGCVHCIDGYYQEDRTCQKCRTGCQLCLSENVCRSCENEYFMIEGEDPICLPFSDLTHCENKTVSGCRVCEDGYYLMAGRCHECGGNCTKCTSPNHCTHCNIDYVLMDNQCEYFTIIPDCLKAENNKCVACTDGLSLTKDGLSCITELNVVMVVTIPLVSIVVICILAVLLIILILILVARRKEENARKQKGVFKMKRVDLEFVPLNDVLVVSKKELLFKVEQLDIPVGEETKDLICIGNTGKNKMKVQIATKEGDDRFTIRTSPEAVFLKKGEACEFEVFITPLCSCELKEDIMIVAHDLKKNTNWSEPVIIDTKTELTTQLDYHELVEDKKLGEGSFGIVFLGTFRGNKVAIKKLKSVDENDAALEEFAKEVSMLEKFRSNYIIHFYGAVFIPGKLCMVTEFAEYGSLQDLMKKRKQDKVAKNMRIKFMIDAAKGIRYLHNNGILHRDIKPDNLLITSLKEDVIINAKLTDFGSSRNVNMMMQNITFTKGVGTPTYIAPEILNHEKYQHTADIFSFAVTMYECLSWSEAYPKETFKFPWKIAEFVMNGERLEKHPELTEEEFDLISKAWNHDPTQRCSLEEIIYGLGGTIDKVEDEIVVSTKASESSSSSSSSKHSDHSSEEDNDEEEEEDDEEYEYETDEEEETYETEESKQLKTEKKQESSSSTSTTSEEEPEKRGKGKKYGQLDDDSDNEKEKEEKAKSRPVSRKASRPASRSDTKTPKYSRPSSRVESKTPRSLRPSTSHSKKYGQLLDDSSSSDDHSEQQTVQHDETVSPFKKVENQKTILKNELLKKSSSQSTSSSSSSSSDSD